MNCKVCERPIKDSPTPNLEVPILCSECNTYNIVKNNKLIKIVRPVFNDLKNKDQPN